MTFRNTGYENTAYGFRPRILKYGFATPIGVARQIPEGRSGASVSLTILTAQTVWFCIKLYDSDDIYFYDICEGSQEFSWIQI